MMRSDGEFQGPTITIDREHTDVLRTFLQNCLKLMKNEHTMAELQNVINRCNLSTSRATASKSIKQIQKYRRNGREMRLNALIGEYEMNQVALDLGSEVNVLTKETWELMGSPKMQSSPIRLRLVNQVRVYSLGRLPNIPIDIDGVRSLADFEVIEIIDDSNLFHALLGIDWAFKNLDVINLKKKQMTFEGHNIKIMTPLDPSMGPRYSKPIRAEEEAREIDDFYKMTTMQK